jgi:D-serine deaminase-like pyridoxal phosphate-dependent protein
MKDCNFNSIYAATLGGNASKEEAEALAEEAFRARTSEANKDAEIAALKAGNAALVEAWTPVAIQCARADETASVAMVEAIQTAALVLNRPHPGAALLEEHSKALARARNEGLEMAARRLAADASHGRWTDASELRAMKEPE